MKLITLMFLIIFAQPVFAAKLNDVVLLKVTSHDDVVELKLRAKDAPPDSFFYLNIVKEDPESFEKLTHVLNKVIRKNRYKLNLNIPSFSPNPPGSIYRSLGIAVDGEIIKINP